MQDILANVDSQQQEPVIISSLRFSNGSLPSLPFSNGIDYSYKPVFGAFGLDLGTIFTSDSKPIDIKEEDEEYIPQKCGT